MPRESPLAKGEFDGVAIIEIDPFGGVGDSDVALGAGLPFSELAWLVPWAKAPALAEARTSVSNAVRRGLNMMFPFQVRLSAAGRSVRVGRCNCATVKPV